MNFIAIIPARYASTRLPAKPLADIHGKPMVVHVMERAFESGAKRVIVAVDHPEVAKVVDAAGGESCMTNLNHLSGTERLAEVIDHYGFLDDQIIINLQGDEPLISSLILGQVAKNMVAQCTNMCTLATPINTTEEFFNPHVVKVVTDIHGYALYFSRASIPWGMRHLTKSQDSVSEDTLLRHIGVYAYRAGFVRRYISWQSTQLERIESLEQLRVLWYGEKIYVMVASLMPNGHVDTPEDLQRVRDYLR